MKGLAPNVSIIILSVNELKSSLKSRDLSECIKNLSIGKGLETERNIHVQRMNVVTTETVSSNCRVAISLSHKVHFQTEHAAGLESVLCRCAPTHQKDKIIKAVGPNDRALKYMKQKRRS